MVEHMGNFSLMFQEVTRKSFLPKAWADIDCYCNQQQRSIR